MRGQRSIALSAPSGYRPRAISGCSAWTPPTWALMDVNDATTGTIIATRNVARGDFVAAETFFNILLDFDLTGRAGHSIETRVYNNNKSYIRVDRLEIIDP